ncbi:MAG: hypothetical protein WAV38_07610, partial [Xanthobacteraceae bacterium]
VLPVSPWRRTALDAVGDRIMKVLCSSHHHEQDYVGGAERKDKCEPDKRSAQAFIICLGHLIFTI